MRSGHAIVAQVTTEDVGYMYIAFIWLLAVFLSNAINIHAGLNGLECGQSLVIASGIIVLNVWSLLTDPTSDVVVGPHVFSLLLIAPFFDIVDPISVATKPL